MSSETSSGLVSFFRVPADFFFNFFRLFRLDARARDVVEAEVGLEGPEREGELGLDLVPFIEPMDSARRAKDGDLEIKSIFFTKVQNITKERMKIQ